MAHRGDHLQTFCYHKELHHNFIRRLNTHVHT